MSEMPIRCLPFKKFQGLGNDFIFFHKDDIRALDPAKLAIQVCNRHFGIGADGMAVISIEEDLRMDFYNADGSIAPMCGNASRCAALFAREEGLLQANQFNLQTKGGDVLITYLPDGNYRANLQAASLAVEDIPVMSPRDTYMEQILQIGDARIELSAVFMTTPHAVIFVNQLKEEDVLFYGPLIENHPLFPAKINVNFVEIVDKNTVKQATWERGAGRTLACGTGSCATVTVGYLTGRLAPEVRVIMDGGSLTIEYSEDSIAMIGGATKIASGIFYL